MTTSTTQKITIGPLKAHNRGQPYSVSFEGQTIIAKSHVPSHDDCRYLVERGLSGSLEVWTAGHLHPGSMIMDIDKAAKWTVSESAATSVRFSDSALYRELQRPAEVAHAV